MSERFKGERTLMRIFVGESDHCPSGPYKGRPLFEALMLLLRDRGFAGATVVRGMAGSGRARKSTRARFCACPRICPSSSRWSRRRTRSRRSCRSSRV